MQSPPQSPHRQRGLSLIELMIGILLGSILLLGVLQIFDSNRTTMMTQVAFSDVQESGRFAMDFLTREIRMADYWGCAPDQESIANRLDSAARSDFQSSIGADGVQGVNNAGTSDEVSGTDVVEGTDILILSGVVDACSGSGRMEDTADASLQVTNSCAVDAGQVVLVSNCKTGDVVTVTGVSGLPGGDSNRTLLHVAGSVNAGWVQNTSDTLQQDYGSEAMLLLPYQRTFFLSQSVSGTSSLFVFEEGDATPRELVPGIDDMQLLYGRDTNGDDVVDLWQEAIGDLDIMADVAAIKVQLLAASDTKTAIGEQTVADLDGDGNETTYTDGRLRKLYITTVKVRNRGSM